MKKPVLKAILAVALAVLSGMLLGGCNQKQSGGTQTGSAWVVTFNPNDRDQAIQQAEVDADGRVEKPNDPVREDYVFTGWYLNKRCAGDPFDFSQEIENDLFLYAGWTTSKVRVTVDFGDDGIPAQVFSVEGGTMLDEAQMPDVPERENRSFTGWFSDLGATEAFDFHQPLLKDTTLYAGWKQTKATVTFDLGYFGGENPAAQVINLAAGEKAVPPEEPIRGDKGDYQFDGWYTGSGKKLTPFNFEEELTSNVELHAVWTQLRGTITYDLGDGTNYTEKVKIGKSARRYNHAQREGCEFLGWYYDSACTSAVDMDSLEITGDLTVYASWKALPRSITYIYNYDGAPDSVTVQSEYGAVTVEPEEPSREDMEFTGWYTDKRCRKAFVFDSPLTEDLKLYAGWGEKGTDAQAGGSYLLTFHVNDGTDAVYLTEEVARNKYSSMRTGGLSFPEREGYKAFGWYTTSDCQPGTKFDPNARITAPMDLYVLWQKAFVFEAELTQLTDIPIGDTGKFEDKLGFGESSNPKGLYLIEWDCYDAGASNDYYVSYLYNPGSYLEFCITAAEEVENATLVLRLTPELHDMFFLTGGENGIAAEKNGYKVYVNPVYSFNSVVNKEQMETYEQVFNLNYDLTGAITKDQDPNYSTKRPFEDYILTGELNLHKGENIIRLVTENTHDYGGSMHAAAPMVDCIKIYTDVELTWTEGREYTSNLDGIDARWPAKQAQ